MDIEKVIWHAWQLARFLVACVVIFVSGIILAYLIRVSILDPVFDEPFPGEYRDSQWQNSLDS